MFGSPNRSGRALLLSVLIVTSVAATAIPVAAQSEQVRGSPSITGSIADNHIAPGERTALTVTLSNNGQISSAGPQQFQQRVKTANNVQVSIDESRIDAPIDIKTGTVTLGALPDGGVTQATFSAEAGQSLSAGTYEIPVELTYTYTQTVNYDRSSAGYTDIEYVDFTKTKKITAEVVVEDQPTFDITPTATDQLTAGESGDYSVEISNTGSQTAEDAAVQLTSQTANIRFSAATQPQPQTTLYVGQLSPGETYNATVEVTATESVTEGQYPIQATVNYETPDGLPDKSDAITIGAEVKPEQRFTITDTSSNLRVGKEGNITATIRNSGPSNAKNAVVKLQPTAQGVEPQRTEFALGKFSADESRAIRFPVTVTDSAEGGPYQFSYVVSYEDRKDNTQRSNALSTQIDVADKRDAFTVTGVSTTVQKGSSKTVELRVTNNDDATLRNINAKTFVDEPLTADSDQSFIQALEPGESTTISFGISVDGDAVTEPRPLELDFRYDESDGDSKLSDTYQVPIDITQSSDGGSTPVGLIAGGVIVVLAAVGIIYWRRTN